MTSGCRESAHLQTQGGIEEAEQGSLGREQLGPDFAKKDEGQGAVAWAPVHKPGGDASQGYCAH